MSVYIKSPETRLIQYSPAVQFCTLLQAYYSLGANCIEYFFKVTAPASGITLLIERAPIDAATNTIAGANVLILNSTTAITNSTVQNGDPAGYRINNVGYTGTPNIYINIKTLL